MKQSSRWWTVAAIVLLGAAVWPAGAVELPPPEQGGPRPGVDIVVGPAGSQPQSVGEVLAMGAESIIPAAGPQITFEATEPGWVYGQQAVFVITGSTEPWRIIVTGTAMNLEGGSPGQSIPIARIQVRDGKKPTGWMVLGGELQNPAGAEDMWMQIEFRIDVEAGDAAGHYQGDVFLEWQLASGAGGEIPLELHLNIGGVMTFTADYSVIYFHIGRSNPGGGNYEMEQALDFHLDSNMNIDNYFGLCVPQGANFDDLRKLTGTIDCMGEDASHLTIPIGWQLRSNGGTGWSAWQAPTEGAPAGGVDALYWLVPAGLFGSSDIQVRCDFEAEPLQSSAQYGLEVELLLAPAL